MLMTSAWGYAQSKKAAKSPPPPKEIVCTFTPAPEGPIEVTPLCPGEEPVYHGGTVEKMPEYPDGIIELCRYINAKMVKSEINPEIKNVKIFVSIIVEKDGSVSNLKVLRDQFNLGNAVVRALQTAPKWKPGTLEGKPVRTQYILPVLVENDNYEGR